MQAVKWAEIPVEKLSETVERQVIWGENATLARFVLRKGTYVSKHKHESEQLTCLQEGVLRLTLDGTPVTLQAGDILRIPPWVEHDAEALEDCVVLDFFSPPRADWKEGNNQYLTGK